MRRKKNFKSVWKKEKLEKFLKRHEDHVVSVTLHRSIERVHKGSYTERVETLKDVNGSCSTIYGKVGGVASFGFSLVTEYGPNNRTRFWDIPFRQVDMVRAEAEEHDTLLGTRVLK